MQAPAHAHQPTPAPAPQHAEPRTPGFKTPMPGSPNPLGAGSLAYGGARSPLQMGKIGCDVTAMGGSRLGPARADRAQPRTEAPQLTQSTPSTSASRPSSGNSAPASGAVKSVHPLSITDKTAESETFDRKGHPLPHEGVYIGKHIRIQRGPIAQEIGRFSRMGRTKAAITAHELPAFEHALDGPYDAAHPMPSLPADPSVRLRSRLLPAAALGGLGLVGGIGAGSVPKGHRSGGAFRAIGRTGRILRLGVPGAALGGIAGLHYGGTPGAIAGALGGGALGGLAGNAMFDGIMPQPTWEREHKEKEAHVLTDSQRARMSSKRFARPSVGETHSGSYPLPDKKHVAIALGFAKMHHDPGAAADVRRRAKSLGLMSKAATTDTEHEKEVNPPTQARLAHLRIMLDQHAKLLDNLRARLNLVRRPLLKGNGGDGDDEKQLVTSPLVANLNSLCEQVANQNTVVEHLISELEV